MNEGDIIFLVEKLAESLYEATAIGHAISVRASSLEDLDLLVRDSVKLHLGEGNLPKIRLQWKGRFGLGSAEGEFTVPDDFNDPLPKEIEDLFYQ